jgi:hypothetical protein
MLTIRTGSGAEPNQDRGGRKSMGVTRRAAREDLTLSSIWWLCKIQMSSTTVSISKCPIGSSQRYRMRAIFDRVDAHRRSIVPRLRPPGECNKLEEQEFSWQRSDSI